MSNTVDTTKSVEERIKFLEKCAKLYETGESSISDKEYDDEYYALQDLAPDHDFFNQVGGLDLEHGYGNAVKHQVTMGSLNKSRNIEEFWTWLKNTHSGIVKFSLTHKVDGASLTLIYIDGKLSKAITRGDGSQGFDVTDNAKYVKTIPQTIKTKEEVEVRGEIYKDRDDFYANWAGSFANPRNMASGALNQKDPLVTKERDLDFVAYEVVRKVFATEQDKLQFLVDNGFTTLESSIKFTKATDDYKRISKAVKVYMDSIDRTKLPYDIDGVVVKLYECGKAAAMGSSAEGRKPKAHRAVKFPTEKKVTTLKGIEWSIGRTGALTPVGLLEPVQLAGTTVQRVSLHNLREMARLKLLNYGAKVVMQKSGEIIPQVVRVEKAGTGERIKAPTECPSCGCDLVWGKNHVTKWCYNDDCPTKLNERIEYWFKTIGVKGIGQGIISKLTDKDILEWDSRPIIRRISEMYYMLSNDRKTEHPFRKYQMLKDHFGEKAYQNIVDNVKSVKEVPLDKFVKGLGIGQIGTMAKDIVAIAPTPQDIDKLTVADIIKLDGFAEKKAKGFINGWKELRPEIERLLGCVSIVQKKQVSSKLAGKKFCFTGSFSSPSRKDMEQLVEDNGGKKSSVSKTLTALVWDGEISGSKIDKANTLGIDIINQQTFLDMLK